MKLKKDKKFRRQVTLLYFAIQFQASVIWFLFVMVSFSGMHGKMYTAKS